MNKIKSLVLVAIGLLCSLSVSAEDFEVDGIYYDIISDTDKTVGVTYRGTDCYSYSNEYSGDVTIPESVTYNGNTYSVTSIGEHAFQYCSSLTSVEIPNSVTSIGICAFNDCYSLTSVYIEDLVAWCNIKFEAQMYSPSVNLYLNGEKVTNLVIPEGVTSIGDYAFYKCSSLTSVVIPNSVTSIRNYAFSGCSSLTSVEIPNSVTSIGMGAFSGCSSLTSVEIPNSVTFIWTSAFSGCSGLTSISVERSNSVYDSREGCNAIIDSRTNTLIRGCENTIIPNSVTSIEDGAFEDCSGLTSLEIPNSVTSIGHYAFQDCSGLTSVVIGNSVTSIGNWAFGGCFGLTSMVIGNSVTSIGEWAFESCSGLTSVVIPNSVTSIGVGAFDNCSSLTSVEIPNSVTSIGDWAFSYCSSLTSVTSLIPAEKLFSPGYGAFSVVDKTSCTLYVPMGAKETYAATGGWNEFVNIEELAPSHYELTDGEEYNEASDMTVEVVTYTRTLPNLHWNALYVPFELPYDVIADRYDVAYINDVNGYDTDDNGTIDDLAMEIIKIKGGTLKANYPYLIKAKTEADKAMSITVEDATLYAAEENSVRCSSVYQNYAVTGIYTKKTTEELAGKLAISTSGAWQPLAAGTALNPFRLYLSIENLDDSPLKVETSAMSRMRIVEHGETTGVETITPAQQREDVIIDLSGRRVKQPVKGGVYIVNGKKQIF